VAESLDVLHRDAQLLAGLVLNDPHRCRPVEIFDEPARQAHQFSLALCPIVGVHAHRSVGLEQQQTAGGRQVRGEA
jgi:hypothetical protein